MEKSKDKLCVGLRETLRAAAAGKLQKVILALDADENFKSKIKCAAEKFSVPVETVSRSADLGARAGIEVKAGVVGVFKTLI